MDQPSTSTGFSRSHKQSHASSNQKRSKLHQSSQSQDDEDGQELNMEPGFIARATANSRIFIDAYNELVKVYPDSRQNFEVKLTKLLETYLSAVINNTSLDNADANLILDFARASMVLQGSTRIYAKKVDLLCQITLQLLGFVDCGIAQQDEEETADGAGPSQPRRRNIPKDAAFDIIEMMPSKNSLKVKVDHRTEKKLAFRPKCFPALIRQEQSDTDKKRITTLNPSFTGDKTTFRLWGPISGEEGHLVLDLSNIKYKFARNIDEENSQDKDDDDWNNDDGDINIEPFVDTPEPENVGIEGTVEEADSITVEKTANAAAPAKEMTADINEDKENINVDMGTDAWNEMSIEGGVESVTLEPKIKNRSLVTKTKLPIQEDLVNNALSKCKSKKSCFGEEGFMQGLKLVEQNKMLPEGCSNSKRKRDVPSLAPTHSESEEVSMFFENESDGEELQGFDLDGKALYIAKETGSDNGEDDETAVPSFPFNDWGLPESNDEDVIGSLTNARLSTAPILADAANEENGFVVPEPPEDTELAARLEAWYKEIRKQQATDAAKPQFTFNFYCQEVLKKFPEDQDTLKFNEIVNELPAGQIARYLLATLQLANTNNVEIRGNIPGQVSNDSMDVILLNKTRVLPSFDDDDE